MPQKQSKSKREAVIVYIGVGSNIAPGENIPKAFRHLTDRTAISATSTFYCTKPLGNRNQPEYRNGVWRIETAYAPLELKNQILKKIEKALKRERSEDRYASRTIDLDLLLYDDDVFSCEGLTVPDPDIYKRPFLAAGLFELDPRLRMPDSGIGIKEVLKRLKGFSLRPDQKLTGTLKSILAESVDSEINQAHLWRREYETLHGINLSFADREPASVSVFRSLIQSRKIKPPEKILDIGCGKGRIGIHLAQAGFNVTGFDVVPSAAAEFRRIAAEKGLEGKVRALVRDMNEQWRIPDDSFDCAFAITVVDNLVTLQAREHFMDELLRVLSPRGLLEVECYSEKDGYYGELLKIAGRESGIVTDPNNGMRFRLYSKSELLELFSPWFKLIHHEKAVWHGIKYNRPYKRDSRILIFQRK